MSMYIYSQEPRLPLDRHCEHYPLIHPPQYDTRSAGTTRARRACSTSTSTTRAAAQITQDRSLHDIHVYT